MNKKQNKTYIKRERGAVGRRDKANPHSLSAAIIVKRSQSGKTTDRPSFLFLSPRNNKTSANMERKNVLRAFPPFFSSPSSSSSSPFFLFVLLLVGCWAPDIRPAVHYRQSRSANNHKRGSRVSFSFPLCSIARIMPARECWLNFFFVFIIIFFFFLFYYYYDFFFPSLLNYYSRVEALPFFFSSRKKLRQGENDR